MTTEGLQDRLGKVIVRRLLETDVERFRTVRLAALRDSPNAFGETLAEAEQSDWQVRTARGAALLDRAVYLAVTDDVPLGMVSVKCATPEEDAFLGGMWVDPQFRRHGVGRALVEKAVDFLRSAGQRRLTLWVTLGHVDALTFYLALGFQETGATSPIRPGSDLTICELSMVIA